MLLLAGAGGGGGRFLQLPQLPCLGAPVQCCQADGVGVGEVELQSSSCYARCQQLGLELAHRLPPW